MRLGVVGFGLRMETFVEEFLRKAAPDIRVVGVVDPDEKGVRQRLADQDRADAVFYKDLNEMVHRGRLDGLAIATSCNMHARYAIQAAKYDIPVYLEKPVATSTSQAVSLEKAFAKSKCQVVVGYPLRLSPLCVMAKKLIDKGAVGSCEHVAVVDYVPYGVTYWERGHRNYEITQGLFLQKASHEFDYISYLVGSPIVRVAAMTSVGRVWGGKKRKGLHCSVCKIADKCPESPKNRRRNKSWVFPESLEDHLCPFSVDNGTPETGMNEDSSSALIEFASGAHGVFTQVFFSRRDAKARGATISGYDGTISFDWYENKLRLVKHHRPSTRMFEPKVKTSHFGGDDELARAFVSLMKGKGGSPSTIWDGIQSTYACLAAKRSAETGRFVKVRQVNA